LDSVDDSRPLTIELLVWPVAPRIATFMLRLYWKEEEDGSEVAF
jgi:hypothetical protein